MVSCAKEQLEEDVPWYGTIVAWQSPNGCHDYASVYVDPMILNDHFDYSGVVGEFNSDEGNISGTLRSKKSADGEFLVIDLNKHQDDLQRDAEKFFLKAGLPLQLIVAWEAVTYRKIIRIISTNK